ncbi:hypothetical protein K7711_36575 [Nocardia sp. CA2R105]|uniref:hypothetical protein n=1 Tax=Nocardia coffeae TaxID=2873381 RepID=UPI001CA65C69|nr:hypothetical protein [Nocardia coffeae]MBY8862040.1 hypothetical protein [Nocardia coffeae]
MSAPERTHTQHAVALLIPLLGLTAITGCTGPTQPQQPPHITTTQVDPQAGPSHLGSTVFQGITLPVADQGPRSDDGTLATGFDHSAVGAALAAIHATVRMSVATDDQFAAVGQHMLAPGPGRDAWALARAQISITGPAAIAPELAGYCVRTYTPERATIAIYTREPDASLTCNTAIVMWQNGDWKLLLPATPSAPTVIAVPAPPADMIALALP